MKNISTIVEKVLIKHIGNEHKELKRELISNLELRLILDIDLTKSFKDAKKEFIKNYLNDLLKLSLGNISLASKRAQLHRRHLHRIINALHINAEAHRKELIKPEEYMKDNIFAIMEETLTNFKEENKIKEIYNNLDDISEIIAKSFDSFLSYDEALELFEKEYIQKALKENNNNISKTAEFMGISERTLYRKINKFNIAFA